MSSNKLMSLCKAQQKNLYNAQGESYTIHNKVVYAMYNKVFYEMHITEYI